MLCPHWLLVLMVLLTIARDCVMSASGDTAMLYNTNACIHGASTSATETELMMGFPWNTVCLHRVLLPCGINFGCCAQVESASVAFAHVSIKSEDVMPQSDSAVMLWQQRCLHPGCVIIGFFFHCGHRKRMRVASIGTGSHGVATLGRASVLSRH